MSVYGNKGKKDFELDDYIENEFLVSTVNETANRIMDHIRDYRITNEGFEDIQKEIEEASNNYELDRRSSYMIMSQLYEAALYNYDHEEYSKIFNVDEMAILEYTGDANKINDFKEMLKKVDNVLVCLSQIVDECIKVLTVIKDSFGKAKNEKQCRDAYVQLKKASEAGVKANNELIKKAGFDSAMRYKKQAKSFTIKYSTISMEIKEEFDKKVTGYADQLLDKVRPWVEGGKDIVDLYKAIDNLDTLLPELSDKVNGWVYLWYTDDDQYRGLFFYYYEAMSWVRFIRSNLRIEMKDSLKYKLVQAVLKK